MDIRVAASVLKWVFALYGLLISIILVHEAGHFVAGLSLGFRITRIRVASFEFSGADGWNLRFRWSDVLTGAVHLQADRRAMEGTAWRMAVMLIAGPLANLLSSAVAALLSERLSRPSVFYGLFILGSLLLGFSNLWPFQARGVQTDGYKFLGLIFSSKHRVQAVARITLLTRVSEFRAAYVAGSYETASARLEEIIFAFALIPELSKDPDARQRFINLQTRIDAFLAGSSERVEALPVLPEVGQPEVDARATLE